VAKALRWVGFRTVLASQQSFVRVLHPRRKVMERKSSWKISRILFTLLVCAFAALPAAAREACPGGGIHSYFTSKVFYAKTYSEAVAKARKDCQSFWPNYDSYFAAGCEEGMISAGGNYYSFNCLKCSTFPLPPRLFPFEQALDIAREVHPGVIIGGSTDEIDIDEHTTLWVYNIDIQQADEIVRVCVDTQTGEIVAAPPADAGDQ
jgi:Peptidase propeptide and YPEB domain